MKPARKRRQTRTAMPPVRAVERAVSIPTALGAEDLRLVDLAERLDLHKATVTRLLASLMDAGLVERDERDRYLLGAAVLRLAARQLAGHRRLVGFLRDALERIRAASHDASRGAAGDRQWSDRAPSRDECRGSGVFGPGYHANATIGGGPSGWYS